ncbi:MAG: nuclear transport factor 2 family protein [Parvularculaceae bacterium]|nr:nuclear transport factor 2 family protein [Parvularculaceae bacterium]
MRNRLTSLLMAWSIAAIALPASALADHRDHDDHSKHSAEQHAAVSSGPAKAVDAFAVALAAQNEALVKKLLAEDVIIAEGGRAGRSLDEFRKVDMGADMQFMSGVKTTLKKRDEIVAGDMAIVISESETKGTDVTKPVHAMMMETMVLTRDGDAWRIRHIHWSSKDLSDAD